jgi:type I restriction enzyme S subunit
MWKVSHKSAQPGFNVKHLKNFTIPLLPLNEQKRISAILDKADEIIFASNEIEKLRTNLIRSVFLELFSEVKSNWPMVQLSDVADITCEFVTPTSPEFNDLPHIGPDRIKGHTGEILPYKSAREDNVTSGKFHFSDNEVLYSKIRPYLRKCAIPDFEGLCSADIYPLTPKDRIVKEYLWYLLLSDEFDRYTQTLPDRSSIPKLNKTELWRFSFPLPPITLQKQFVDVVNSVNSLLNIQDLAEIQYRSLAQEMLT